jgi:hypothetical protein
MVVWAGAQPSTLSDLFIHQGSLASRTVDAATKRSSSRLLDRGVAEQGGGRVVIGGEPSRKAGHGAAGNAELPRYRPKKI